MKTSFPTTVIELSQEEAIDIYYAMKRAIEDTIDTHWHNHPDSYEELESRRLHILVELGRSVGYDRDVLTELRERLVAKIKAATKLSM